MYDVPKHKIDGRPAPCDVLHTLTVITLQMSSPYYVLIFSITLQSNTLTVMLMMFCFNLM